jgi:hypothetical protein
MIGPDNKKKLSELNYLSLIALLSLSNNAFLAEILPDDKRPEHRFLRVKGGFLLGTVTYSDNSPVLSFRHYDVD